MKKTNIILALSVVGLLASCGGKSSQGAPSESTPPHEHTYSEEWSSDADGHWHAPTCGDTAENKDYAAHDFNSDRVCTVCGYVQATRVDVSPAAAFELIQSQIANDGNYGSSLESVSYSSHAYQAVYMGLSLTDDLGNPINLDGYDQWYETENFESVSGDKVFYEDYSAWSGYQTTAPNKNASSLYGTSVYEAYYKDGNIVVMNKDDEGSWLAAVYGQAYCDWWNMTYGPYAASYIDMYTMEKFDDAYFGSTFGKAEEALTNLSYLATYYDDDDSVEDPDELISISCEGWSDYSTLTVSALVPAYDTVINYYTEGKGNGYADAVDSDLDITYSATVKFNTTTGEVLEYSESEVYSTSKNPNTGAELDEPYVISSKVTKYSDFGARVEEFAGDKIEFTAADEALYSYYGIWYETDKTYWFITVTNGYPGTYFVDHTKFNKRINTIFIDGFTSANPPAMEDGSVVFTGAKAQTVTNADETTESVKLVYTMTVNADGNLDVVAKRSDNGAEVSSKTYYSAANFAALSAGE